MARTAVLGASLAIIGILAVLTIERGHPAGSGHPGGDLADRADRPRHRRAWAPSRPRRRMSRSGPPPVPPRGVLTEGRRRGRRGRVLALLLLIVPAVLGAAAYLALTSDTSSGGGSARPRPSRRAALRSTPTPPKPAAPAPLVPAEPVPDVPLAGGDTVRVHLREPPRAGLMFDLNDGKVLWRRRPLKVLPMASLTKIMTAILVTERAGRGPGRRSPRRRCATRARASACCREGSACRWSRSSTGCCWCPATTPPSRWPTTCPATSGASWR